MPSKLPTRSLTRREKAKVAHATSLAGLLTAQRTQHKHCQHQKLDSTTPPPTRRWNACSHGQAAPRMKGANSGCQTSSWGLLGLMTCHRRSWAVCKDHSQAQLQTSMKESPHQTMSRLLGFHHTNHHARQHMLPKGFSNAQGKLGKCIQKIQQRSLGCCT